MVTLILLGSVTLDTACSGTLQGIDIACRYLQTGEITSAIVAGANLFLRYDLLSENICLKIADTLCY